MFALKATLYVKTCFCCQNATHLHFDHTSGLPALPDNLIYVAGKGEEYISIKLLVEPNHFNKNDIVYVFDFNSEEARTHPIGKAMDILGDNSLNRISKDQALNGTYVPRGYTQPGDLVFYSFEGNGVISHVGIYIGAGKMINSPKTGDVVKITDVTTSYWTSRYVTTRRIIQ